MQSTNPTDTAILKNQNPSAAYDRATEILQTTYGYQNFRLNQADIIRALLDNRDVMALMPTGGGKSLCYQIPSLVRDGTGVIISPLIALMQDQVNALKQLGVRAAFLNSTLSSEQVNKTEQALCDGQLDMVYVAPERLLTERMLNLLDKVRIAL
ncbi:MAG: DEAD/DEAH box helicase, partial [Gammaproteobacteria bacterium]